MENKIELKLDYSKPVELSDISLALYAVSHEFQRFSNKSPLGNPSSKLYLDSVERGSIIAQLSAYTDYIPIINDNLEPVIEFVKKTKELLGYLMGEKTEKPEFDKKELDNIEKFLEPVAKDVGGKWTIKCNHIENLTINYQQANTAQRNILREKELLEEPIAGFYSDVVLTFNQTHSSSNKGNRATIESICRMPVKTIFDDEKIHGEMILNEENPLTGIYLVDVRVETVRDKPILYKIMAFHERIE